MNISADSAGHSELEIGHVLFMDVVGYSKLLINEQREIQRQLAKIVKGTEEFRLAETAGKLIRLPAGDGMALVFFSSPEAPVRCALEIANALQENFGSAEKPQLRLRMGIHSGPVSGVVDVNDRSNVAGAGINMAQRVMDCGDAGHILLSKRAADDLAQDGRWRPQLHELGEYSVKHGVAVPLVNLYTDTVGNPQLPEKIKRARQQRGAAALLRKSLVTGAVAGAALLIALFVYHRRPFRSSEENIPQKSVAVLPFENLSKDEDNAYFAGGVQDEILSDLARVADLKVISRTSVMKYKRGPERNLREIAKALGVSHVVEGSVQRAGERIRVTAQLIDARDDSHIWADHYDRDLSDIFAVQSEIAQHIADQLRAKLSEEEKTAIQERPTSDMVAYAYYTRAQELDTWTNWEGDEKNQNQKVELLEKATQRDPKFALAYCALAKTHIDLSSMVGEPDNRKHLELAREAAEVATRVRPDLGEAHLELARYYFYAGVSSNDYSRARDELAVVRRKLPNNAEALMIDARIGRHEGRWEASLAELQKANELDPRNDEVGFRLWEISFEMRHYSECEQLVGRRAANDPSEEPAHQLHWADMYLARGDAVAAQSFLSQVPLDYSPGFWIWDIRFRAALYRRDYDAAARVISATPARWAELAFGEQGAPWAEAQVWRARGDKQKAAASFETARNNMEARDLPREASYFSELAVLDAGLGRKEQAIGEAQRAVELLPVAKDAVNGPTLIARLALVYAWTGERDRALEQLQKGATVPAGLTYGDLRLNPCWDELRADPRFDNVLAAAKLASR